MTASERSAARRTLHAASEGRPSENNSPLCWSPGVRVLPACYCYTTAVVEYCCQKLLGLSLVMIQLLFREQTQCVWLCRVYPLGNEKQRTSRRLLRDLKKSLFFVDAKTLQCCLVRGRKHLKTIRRKLLASSSSLSSVVYLSAALVSQASFSKKGSSVFLKTDCKCCLSEFGEVSCSARECCFIKHYQKIKKIYISVIQA